MSDQKNVLILYPVDYEDGKNMGIYQKMLGQGKALKSLGCDVDFLFIEGKDSVLQWNGGRTVLDQGIFHGWTKYKRIFSTLSHHLEQKRYDIILIRHLVFTTPLFHALQKAEKKECKIVYEFPCWPYEKEWSKGMGSLLMSIDKRNRERTLKCVDLVLHFGGFDLDFVDSLQMSNGLYIEDGFQNKSGKDFDEGSPMRMIAVGKWAPWHGVDRLIKGFSSKTNDTLEILGDGPASSSLKRLVAKKDLETINFRGEVHGSDLTNILHQSDIGIGTLGIHRKKVRLNSSLKHRLYCAHGLPFILSSADLDFPEDWPFCLYQPEDDKKINIKKIYKWYVELIIKYPDYRKQMFHYAKENLGWTKQMQKVLTALKNQESLTFH